MQPKLPTKLEQQRFIPTDDGFVQDVHIINEIIPTSTHLQEFHRVRFTNVRFEDSTYYFSDCIFENCDLANVTMRATGLLRCRFVTSRFTGINLSEATLKHVQFSDCHMHYASFAFSKLQHLSFTDCLLRDTDFAETTCKDVNFIACELTGANFSKTPLACVDLHQSYFEQLTLEIDNLPGCTVNEQQAQQFL